MRPMNSLTNWALNVADVVARIVVLGTAWTVGTVLLNGYERAVARGRGR